MDAQALIKRIRAGREVWLELEPASGSGDDAKPAKRVRIRRPAEAEMRTFLVQSRAEAAVGVVVGWDGFTEADLLGDSVGAADAVSFDADLWAEVVRDRADWISLVTDRAVALVQAHQQLKAESEKN